MSPADLFSGIRRASLATMLAVASIQVLTNFFTMQGPLYNYYNYGRENLVSPTSDDSPTTTKSGSYFQRSNDGNTSTMNMFHSTVRFVFIIGLEGTGHHFMGSIIRSSPARQYLSDIGVYKNVSTKLGKSLYHSNTANGLWNAHCTNALEDADQRLTKQRKDEVKKKKNKKLNSDYDGLNDEWTTAGPDVNRLLDQVVENLKTIEAMAQANPPPTTGSAFHVDDDDDNDNDNDNDQNKDNNTKQKNSTIAMGLNTWLSIKEMGMVSYPNFRGNCRDLNYPNLDLLYRACDMAHVDCQHVYIHRNPYSIINSANRRGFNDNILQAIHLYTTHLHIISSQLYSHGRRTVGCYDLFQKYSYNSTASYEGDGWSSIAKLFGWNNQIDFERSFQKIYKVPATNSSTTMTESQKLSIVPKKFQAYLTSMFDIHHRVIDVCQRQVEENDVWGQGKKE